ncbi:RagB/SusD family nutrient uptake outer membrane protein [Puteibacter caeruleilacunae]|nr:RagB/SusD family nutrient uptake outer membrane protein [Puteibacter caeruleilacunae]
MKKMKNILLLLFIVFAMSSCEDFLQENPPTFISSTNYWKTESDARTGCDGVYKALNDGSSNSIYGRWWPAVDVATDDVTSKVRRNNFAAWMSHSITSSHSWFDAWKMYSSFWVGISRANMVIHNVPNIEMDEAKRNAIVGEAKALRALFYYHLVRAYGDVPKVVHIVKGKEDYSLPRTNVESIYDEIIVPDLKYAEENCQDELHKGRITKWTAKVILADVYLTRAGWRRSSQGEFVQGDASYWALARDKAKEIIDNSPHELVTAPIVNGKNITPACGVPWSLENPFSKESMMELAHINEGGFGSWITRECSPFSNGLKFWGKGGAKPLLKEGIKKNVIQMRFPGKPAASGMFIPSVDLWRSFEAGDERKDWGLMTRYITPEGDNYLCQPTFRKYVDTDYFLGKENTTFMNTNVNFIMYRYADALLIYAEAANEVKASVNGDDAYDAINEVRNRAGLADLPGGLSQEDFRKAVWHERRVEFHAECKRKFDLVRTNRLKTETANIAVKWEKSDGAAIAFVNSHAEYTGTQVWPDHEWLFPIPETELNLNKENGWVQNEGY